MSKIALQVLANADVYELEFDSETSLKVLQTAVDGLIQPVDITAKLTMWVNEEGLFRSDFEQNILATAFMPDGASPIMGPAVFTGGVDDNGETLGLSREDADSIRALANNVKELASYWAKV